MPLATVVMLMLARTTPTSFAAGLPLVLAGQAIRVWAAGYIAKLQELVTAGPFAMCRNPLYLGSSVIAVGYFAMCNRLDMWIAGMALFWLFFGGAVAYEEKLLREKFGDEYVAYCTCVPRLIPRIGGPKGRGAFSLDELMNNNEHRVAMGTVLIVGLFGVFAFCPNLRPLDRLTQSR